MLVAAYATRAGSRSRTGVRAPASTGVEPAALVPSGPRFTCDAHDCDAARNLDVSIACSPSSFSRYILAFASVSLLRSPSIVRNPPVCASLLSAPQLPTPVVCMFVPIPPPSLRSAQVRAYDDMA